MALTTFIPQIWDARLLAHLDKAHVFANLVNRNYEGSITGQGDTVHINQIGDVSIKNYTKNTDIDDPDALSTTDQTLVIDQAKYFNFAVDDVDKVQAAGDLVDAATQRASYGLADADDQFVAGLLAAGVNASNVIDTTALTSANAYDMLVALGQKLDEANVTSIGRAVVVPPAFHSLLLKDNRFVTASEAANSVLINGMVGNAAGFEIHKSNNCVKTADATPVYSICAFVSDACTYAQQFLNTEAYRPQKRFSDAIKGLHVYGAKVTNGKEIAVLKGTF